MNYPPITITLTQDEIRAALFALKNTYKQARSFGNESDPIYTRLQEIEDRIIDAIIESQKEQVA